MIVYGSNVASSVKWKLTKSRGGRCSSQTQAETGCTSPSSVEIVIKPCHCIHQAGRYTPLPTENTINWKKKSKTC